MADDVNLRLGLNVYDGKVTYKAVEEALGDTVAMTYASPESVLGLSS